MSETAATDKAPGSVSGPQAAERYDSTERSERALAVSRFILALSALAIIVLDPRQPLFGSRPLYVIVASYALYSAILLYLFSRQQLRLQAISERVLFADVGWYTLIIALSEGGTSLFYLFYLFTICNAAIHWGARMTMRIAFLCAVLYLGSILAVRRVTLGPDAVLQSAHFIRPTYLVLLGYLVGLIGEHELAAKKRLVEVLALQRMASRSTDPMATLVRSVVRVGHFYEADYLLVQMRMPDGARFEWEGVRSDSGRFVIRDLPTTSWLPASSGPLSYRVAHNFGSWGRVVECYASDESGPDRINESDEPAFLARSRMRSLISVPISAPEGHRGRILVSRARSNYSRQDLDFFRTLVAQGAIILDKLLLRVKAEDLAVAEERARIARDVHDGFVQSLASLDVGLEVCRKLQTKDPEGLAVELEAVQRNVKQGYRDARRYLEQLREHSALGPDVDTAVGEMVRDFRGRGETVVELHTDAEGIPARHGVGRELVQIVREGLSNIARHADAGSALVSVEAGPSAFRLTIKDNGRGFPAAGAAGNGELPISEAPWSIRERVEALGGTLKLRSEAGGGSEIEITLPRREAQ
jgi:signal transduction histidine kinase